MTYVVMPLKGKPSNCLW